MCPLCEHGAFMVKQNKPPHPNLIEDVNSTFQVDVPPPVPLWTPVDVTEPHKPRRRPPDVPTTMWSSTGPLSSSLCFHCVCVRVRMKRAACHLLDCTTEKRLNTPTGVARKYERNVGACEGIFTSDPSVVPSQTEQETYPTNQWRRCFVND